MKVILKIVFSLLLLSAFFVRGFDLASVPTNLSEMSLAPTTTHWLGTNQMGQDVFDLIATAISKNLIPMIFVLILAIIVGVIMGLFLIPFRKFDFLSIALNALSSIPVFALAILFLLWQQQLRNDSIQMIFFCLIVISCIGLIQQSWKLDRRKSYVQASLALGSHPIKSAWRHGVRSNWLRQLLILAGTWYSAMIVLESTLSYLNLIPDDIYQVHLGSIANSLKEEAFNGQALTFFCFLLVFLWILNLPMILFSSEPRRESLSE